MKTPLTPARTIRADLTELLFRTRNRAYGAYVLRKRTDDDTLRSFIAVSLAFIVVTAGPGLFRDPNQTSPLRRPLGEATIVDVLPEQFRPPTRPQSAQPPARRRTVAYTPPVVVPDQQVRQEQPMPAVDTLLTSPADIGHITSPGSDDGAPGGEPDGTGTAPTEVVEPPKDPGPSDWFPVERLPEASNLEAVRQRIAYPPLARESGIDGLVVVRVLVGSDGRYVRHVVIRSPHATLTREVEKHLPALSFVPAVQSGNAIRCWVTIPFKFSLR